ncbi:N-(5'-phosphoribosyl)anthranilate isomerase [Shimia sp. CNT1-13L.2]|uniref:N-(5'-phosphoribosyl)anthranilate isomerase n=1 Tax=Shimia sp. CNT1-13L.2 TaxID=2959663 RepID=UPI0020CEC5B8|nr:N-(5'-phosphoribosyl)anthranilate isomerase [Shimia sp. CNT1-13L.2]MCP9482688.1 N-(5'-phosphoribosyl)anthranilate isomerase [Shimia sp. CNT1-13L.2]
MASLPDHLTAEQWQAQFLGSAEARRGGVVKRQIRDVERLVGREPLPRPWPGAAFEPMKTAATLSCSAMTAPSFGCGQGLSKALVPLRTAVGRERGL